MTIRQSDFVFMVKDSFIKSSKLLDDEREEMIPCYKTLPEWEQAIYRKAEREKVREIA